MKFKNKLIDLIKNKHGGLSIPMVPIVIAFVISVVACIEYFILVSSFNDIQMIMDSVANGALRSGIKHELHKDETIIDSSNIADSIDTAKVRETYADLLFTNLQNSISKYALEDSSKGLTIKDNFQLMKETATSQYVVDTTFKNNPRNASSPVIRIEKTSWSNTFMDESKLVDTIVLDAVAQVNLKTSRFIPDKILNYTFTRKEHDNVGGSKNTTFKVEAKSTVNGFTTYVIRSSTRMILK